MVGQWFLKMKESLNKTREALFTSLDRILPFGASITPETLAEVEEVLYNADFGVHAVEVIVSELKQRSGNKGENGDDPFTIIKETVLRIVQHGDIPPSLSPRDFAPFVMLVIGVNGTGKTTTIGKLAWRYKAEGYKVLLAGCDTFRAAASDQLDIWANRAGADLIRAPYGSDPASVAYDAMMRAQARLYDVVIIDTAGRLHTSHNLMEELKKIQRVVKKVVENAPHEVLLVLDATTGQNALKQAETFHRELTVTGITLTKLDGTAKGGIVVSIIDKLGIPVKFIGIGEGVEDIRDFEPGTYVDALFARDKTRSSG
jgi:fused signal recognition particle receptor